MNLKRNWLCEIWSYHWTFKAEIIFHYEYCWFLNFRYVILWTSKYAGFTRSRSKNGRKKSKNCALLMPQMRKPMLFCKMLDMYFSSLVMISQCSCLISCLGICIISHPPKHFSSGKKYTLIKQVWMC